MGLFSKLFGSKKKDNKYKLGMNKTRTGVLGNLKKLLSSKKLIDDELFDELEEMFTYSLSPLMVTLTLPEDTR